jgi:hypothetical protein
MALRVIPGGGHGTVGLELAASGVQVALAQVKAGDTFGAVLSLMRVEAHLQAMIREARRPAPLRSVGPGDNGDSGGVA